MAFGARRENGGWHLCLRKGRTITKAVWGDRQIEVRFPSQIKAKACADILNEKYWDQFDKAQRGKIVFPNETAHAMMDVIEDHAK